MEKRLVAVLRSQWSRLHALLYRLTLREDAAEDLLQELFLKLDRSEGFARADNPAGYAHRAAVNLAMDWRQGRQRNLEESEIDGLPAAGHTPIDRLIEQERFSRVLNALVGLSESARQVVVLRFIEQWEYERIATEIGKTAHQTRAMCHDAIQMLRQRLSPNPEEKVSHGRQ